MGNGKYLTKEGLKKIKEELDNRKKNIRKEISLSIKEAKEQGDLSENAEYSEAKSRETENEKRIAELESIAKNSTVIRKNSQSKKVELGSSVKVRAMKVVRLFDIVGSDEANPASNKISNESPIGAALLGGKLGDTVSVQVPEGTMKYKIIGIENK
ncbi:MAG: transcription elongation factor GreA [Patescibacteria group bacterium]|nr:transcription elongation factor GreA [Patescibacteria group bacterium]